MDKPVDEQAERIKEAVKDYQENPGDYTFRDWEEMFEDRDPFEFL
jgi:predicted dehydrogenase